MISNNHEAVIIMEAYASSEVTEDYLKSDRSLYGGLLGVAIVTTVQLLGVSHLDCALKIGSYAFALAIPLLTTSLHSRYAGGTISELS